MNATHKTLAAIIVVLVFAPVALAAAPPPGPKLYRWVGQDGKVHYSDDLPPEALDAAREEISKKSGITIGQVERALTVDERAAEQAKATADATAAATIEKAKKNDQVLLASYSTEADLKHAYDERLGLQAAALRGVRISIQNQEQGLNGLLIAASNLELGGKPVNTDLAGKIQIAHAQVLEQQQAQLQSEAQAANLRQERAAQLAHYHTLRAAADAEATAPTTPNAPPPLPPKKG